VALDARAVYELAAFSETERRTLRLIADYLTYRRQETGEQVQCFTYKGLRWWYNRQRYYKQLEWHTAERVVRRLAELGWLTRRIYPHRGAKRVVFCISSNLEQLLQQLGWLR